MLVLDLYPCITSLRFGACHESRAPVPGEESPDEPIPAPYVAGTFCAKSSVMFPVCVASIPEIGEMAR